MKTSLSEKRAWPFFLMCILVAFYLIFIVQLSFTRLWPLWMSLAAGAILSVFLIRISRITENAGFSLPAMPAPFRFRIFAAFFLASSAIRLLYLLAYFPGGASVFRSSMTGTRPCIPFMNGRLPASFLTRVRCLSCRICFSP